MGVGVGSVWAQDWGRGTGVQMYLDLVPFLRLKTALYWW